MHNVELKFRRLFETAQDGILILEHPSGDIIDANPFILELIGYPKSFLIKKKLWEIGFIIDKKKALNIFKELIKKDYIRYEHLDLRHHDGYSLPVEFVCNSYLVDDKKVIQCNIRDISDRVALERTNKEFLDQKVKDLNSIIGCLSTIIESRDLYTAGHQFRVSDLAVKMAKLMKLDLDSIQGIQIASLLHDIGKFKIPAELLVKPGKLLPEEYALIKLHSQWGYEILKSLNFPQDVPRFVLEHHERIDGSGYPYGLKDKQISIEAKVIAVADVAEAMTTARAYRPALELQKFLQEIELNKGKLYDVDVVDACMTLFIKEAYQFPIYNVS